MFNRYSHVSVPLAISQVGPPADTSTLSRPDSLSMAVPLIVKGIILVAMEEAG